MTPRYRAVFFDVNHTLIGMRDEVKTQADAVRVLYEDVRAMCVPEPSYADFERLYNEAWSRGKQITERYEEVTYESIVALTLSRFGIRLSPIELDEVLQRYMQPLYSATYAIPGMRELLNSLSSRVALGAITNYKYTNGMLGLLRAAGLADLIPNVTISAQVGWKKPSHRIYESAAQKLGFPPQDCILVGNELEKDLWQANLLGMKTIWFTPDEHEFHDVEFAEALRERLAGTLPAHDFRASSVPELEAHLLALL